MQEDQLRRVLEQVNTGNEIPNSKMEEIVSMIKEEEKKTMTEVAIEEKNENYKIKAEAELRQKLSEETDWKERLKIMAKIISLGLD